MIYLDNAATSWPKPESVLRAVMGVQQKPFGNPGRGGHRASLCAGRVVYACREEAARFLGGVPERVIFTLNCTDALNMALRGFLHKGDHVLITHDAHNAVMRPLCGMEKRGEITLSVLRAGADGLIAPEAIDEAVTPATALCVLTHASNVTGTIQDAKGLTEASHRYGVPVLLDAAQTAGTINLADIGADLLAMPGHKGLLGPMGTGILYVGEQMDLRPLRAEQFCAPGYFDGKFHLTFTDEAGEKRTVFVDLREEGNFGETFVMHGLSVSHGRAIVDNDRAISHLDPSGDLPTGEEYSFDVSGADFGVAGEKLLRSVELCGEGNCSLTVVGRNGSKKVDFALGDGKTAKKFCLKGGEFDLAIRLQKGCVIDSLAVDFEKIG